MNKLTASAFSLVVAMSAGAAFAHGDWESKFKSADTNGDKALSMEEWNAESKEMFAKIDANKDGKVSWDEKKAFVEMKKDGKMDNAHKSDTMGNNRPTDHHTGDEKIQDNAKKDLEKKSN